MVWIDSVNQLQFYKQSHGLPCYCEPAIEPNDILLQAAVKNAISPIQIGGGGSAQYRLKVEVYSADGLTLLEDATSYFEWYAFAEKLNLYVNMRLKKYSPAMCSSKCFILKATVLQGDGTLFITIFSKYTERYCIDNCCTLPGDIGIDVNDGTPTNEGEYDPLDYGKEYYNIS